MSPILLIILINSPEYVYAHNLFHDPGWGDALCLFKIAGERGRNLSHIPGSGTEDTTVRSPYKDMKSE